MRLPIASALFLLGGLLSAGVALADYPDCLEAPATPAALEAWRAAAVSNVTGNAAGRLTVAGNIKKCFNEQVPACLQRTLNYAQQDDLADASQDKPYEDVPERQPPPELLAPNGPPLTYFVRPDIEELSKAKGWPTIRYKSRHSGGFDSGTASLLMVYIPGDKVDPPVNYDRWLNFALPVDPPAEALTPLPQVNFPTVEDFANNPGANYPRTFTMISMSRADENTPAKVWFQMFRRAGNGGNFAPGGNVGLNGCISCHPNGMRAISPLGFHVDKSEAQLPEDAWLATRLINEAMDTNAGGKLVDWRNATDAQGNTRPFMHPDAYWPIVGATKPMNPVSRTQAFIIGGTLPDGTQTPGCFKSRKTISITDIFGRPPGASNVYRLSDEPLKDWRKVRTAMMCETCHNNKARYALNRRTDRATIDYKILVDKSMPPGAHQNPIERGDASLPATDSLTLDERISVANCLQAEMALEEPLVGKWLSQQSCQ